MGRAALDIAGGVGWGISRGIEDLERIERDKFDKTQRARTIKKQQEDDDIEAELARVRAPGKYKQMIEGPAGTEGGVEVPTEVNRSDADYARDVAGVYAGRGKVPQAIAARATARQLSEQERADGERARFAEVAAKFRPMRDAIDKDPFSVLDQGADDYNANVPDGHTAYRANTPTGRRYTIINDKSGKVLKTYEVTKADAREKAALVVQGMMMRELGEISPEMYLKSFEKGLDLTRLSLEGRRVAADEQRATTDAQRAQTTDDIARSTIEMNLAHGRYYDAQRNRLAAATKEGNPFKLAVVRRGKESVPVSFRLVPGPDGKGQVPQAYDITGKPITDPNELKSLFTQPAEDPFEVAIMDAAKKSGDPDAVVKAEGLIKERRAGKALEQAKAEWKSVPAEEKDAAYAELVAKGAPPEAIKEITGGYKPKKKPAKEAAPQGVGIAREAYTKFRQPTAEEKMSSMTHK